MSDPKKPDLPLDGDSIKIDAKEFRDMQRQLAELSKGYSALAAQKAELEKALSGNVLPEDEQPRYLLAQPYYSPDDVYYLEGMIITDVCGDIVPNEFMIPQNAAAQQRYDAAMEKLAEYGTGRQPTLYEIIDAASRVTRELGPTASGDQIQAALMAAVITKVGTGQGRRAQPGFAAPSTQLRPNAAVPLMSNTNIIEGGTPHRPAAPPRRGPQRTRAAGQAPEPSASVQGSVQSQPLSYQQS